MLRRTHFRVHDDRAVLAKVPDFLALAGSMPPPPETKGMAWSRVRAQAWAEGGRFPRSKEPRAWGVSLLVDTNGLVRHVTGDPPSQARRATEFLRAGHQLLLTDMVLAEVLYVLDSVYGFAREQVVRAARSLLAHPGVAVIDAAMLLRALELYESVRLDFAEAYLAAAAERFGLGRVASFDRALDRVATIERVEPSARMS